MFVKFTKDNGPVQPWELLPAAADHYVPGQALTVTGGKLTAVAEAMTTTPEYICQAKVEAADGQMIPVIRTASDIIFETTLSAATDGAVVGAKLEVTGGGLEVDGTAAGSFELVYVGGIAKGSVVRGRFL